MTPSTHRDFPRGPAEARRKFAFVRNALRLVWPEPRWFATAEGASTVTSRTRRAEGSLRGADLFVSDVLG